MSQREPFSLHLRLVPTTRRIVYLFVYSTWGTRIHVAPCPITGTTGTIAVDRPPHGTVLPHYASVVIQLAELIDCRVVLTGVALVPLHDLQPHFAKAIAFADEAQDDALIVEGTVDTPDDIPLFSTIEPDVPTLLARFEAATADYTSTADAFTEQYVPSRPDLPQLYMTTFAQRIGRAFPDILFFDVERTGITQADVLEQLLRASCFYIGIGEDLFVSACGVLAELGDNRNAGQPSEQTDLEVLETAVEAIVFAACIPAILTPYAFDKYVSRFGDVRTGERFSSVRVPSVRRRDAAADCEEMSKSNAMLLLDMQTIEVVPPSARLLGAARRALGAATVYSTLMLVKNPNVDTAKDGAGAGESAVPLNASTGHMCGLLQMHGARALSVATIPIAEPREHGLNGMYLAEGTGNIRSDIRPYAAPDADRNNAVQARIRESPFARHKWDQRLNMTHGTLFVDDVMSSPNNFYTVLKYAFPLYRGIDDARSYLAVNAREGTYGVPVSNMVTAGTDATLVRRPELTPEMRELCRAMMSFMPPEVPLTITREPSPAARAEIAAFDARLRKGDPSSATRVLSFMKEYGETTVACLDEIVAWVAANTDIVHCDTMLFGEILHASLVMVRLFFR